MEKVLLEVKNLAIHFGSQERLVKAADGVSFVLEEGQTLGILGESGSGKSVTGLSIMQLLREEQVTLKSGQILWHETEHGQVDLMNLPSQKMEQVRGQEIAMIFQDPMSSLNPVMKCGDQILEVVQKTVGRGGTDKSLVMEWLKKVKLPDAERIYHSYPHQLSGGQLQRIMIAMAMAGEPRLLIADEPTTALDVTIQKSILQLVNDLKSTFHTSIIFISHDLGVINEVADVAAVMYRGKIVEYGEVRQIMTGPVHPYTKALLACRPPIGKKLKRLPVLDDFMTEEDRPSEDLFDSWTQEEMDDRLASLREKPPLLEVTDINTWFVAKKDFWGRPKEWVKAVNDVSLEVYPGETVGLVGESGCGKTTLGRSILGLEKAARGSVRYQGVELLELTERAFRPYRKDLQIVFQNPFASLNPRMSVGEMLMEPMKVFKIGKSKLERKRKAMDLLQTVGLEERHFYRNPRAFSGGQRQRIAIARALTLQPKFIICDESVSSLDVSVQAQILNLLLDLQQQLDLTYLFISHDLSVVRYVSDRIIVMNKGVVVEEGPTESVFNDPQSEYTERLLQAIPGWG